MKALFVPECWRVYYVLASHPNVSVGVSKRDTTYLQPGGFCEDRHRSLSLFRSVSVTVHLLCQVAAEAAEAQKFITLQGGYLNI